MPNTASESTREQWNTSSSSDQTPRVQLWASRAGSLALVGLASAHAITNARGFGGGDLLDWILFLVFGLGLSGVLATIAVVTWRYPRHRRGGRAARVITWRRVIILLAAGFCLVAMVNVLRLHPEVIGNPAGPGPWVVIASPALWIVGLMPTRWSSHHLGDPRMGSAEASCPEGG